MQRTNRKSFFLSLVLSLGFFGLTTVAPATAEEGATVREKLRTFALPTQGGQCAATAGLSRESIDGTHAAFLLSQVAANADAEQQATATTDGVLNGRGYNYGPDPGNSDFVLVQRELELMRQSQSK